MSFFLWAFWYAIIVKVELCIGNIYQEPFQNKHWFPEINHNLRIVLNHYTTHCQNIRRHRIGESQIPSEIYLCALPFLNTMLLFKSRHFQRGVINIDILWRYAELVFLLKREISLLFRIHRLHPLERGTILTHLSGFLQRGYKPGVCLAFLIRVQTTPVYLFFFFFLIFTFCANQTYVYPFFCLTIVKTSPIITFFWLSCKRDLCLLFCL